MIAILWDGIKQLKGVLKLGEEKMSFDLLDFSETNLNFSLGYSEIKEMNYHHLFELNVQGVEIESKHHDKNIFIVEEPLELKRLLEQKINKLSNI